MLNLLRRLLSREPVELRPGLNALGFGTIKLSVRIYRAAENRWYELDEVKS